MREWGRPKQQLQTAKHRNICGLLQGTPCCRPLQVLVSSDEGPDHHVLLRVELLAGNCTPAPIRSQCTPLRWQEIPDPITADRLLSLYARGGDDDMFSSDLSDAELAAMLSPLGVAPCLVLQAGMHVGACVSVVHACRWCMRVGGASVSVVHACRWCMRVGGACVSVGHACRWGMRVGGACVSVGHVCRWCMRVGGACRSIGHACRGMRVGGRLSSQQKDDGGCDAWCAMCAGWRGRMHPEPCRCGGADKAARRRCGAEVPRRGGPRREPCQGWSHRGSHVAHLRAAGQCSRVGWASCSGGYGPKHQLYRKNS
eukprot:358075-Chlamydomonas_euryale.AAC.4